LKLNKLISFMYTDEFKEVLPKSHYSIVQCLDVTSLYNLHGLKHDEFVRNPTDKPPDIVPLEKAVIWIQNVRDYICRIMAVASYFDAHFFDNDNGMNMMMESVISYWHVLPLSHFAIIIKHFLMNFVQLCSPKYYPQIIPFLCRFLCESFKNLNLCWQSFIIEFAKNNKINLYSEQSNEWTLGKQSSSTLRNEVFEEFALRNCSQKLFTALACIIINHKERGFILLYDDKIDKQIIRQKLKKQKKNDQSDFIAQNFDSKDIGKYNVSMSKDMADGDEENQNENGNVIN